MTPNDTRYALDIQSAFAERTIKRLAILNALLTVALIVNVVLDHIKKTR